MRALVCLLLIATTTTYAGEPRFVNGGGQHEVKQGGQAAMRCQAADIEHVTIMWQRERAGAESETLTIADMLLANDDRYDIKVDATTGTYEFTIRDVEPIDSGEYKCTMSTEPEQTQLHRLIVKVPPKAKIDYDGGIYTVRPGEQLNLRCTASGNPKPSVEWRGPTGDVLEKGPILAVDDVQETNGGQYTCTASSSEGESQETIKVQVQSSQSSSSEEVKPRIRVEKPYMPVLDSEHVTVNITCLYSANPQPQIVWTHNGFQIKTRAKADKYREYSVQRNDDTLAVLEIVDLTSDDLGTYTCQASNNMGNAEAKIQLDNKPGPAEIKVETFADRVEIKVHVSSPTEITEWEIKYLDVTHDKDWQNKIVKPTKHSRSVTGSPRGSGDWESDFALDNLKPETEYKISVRAKNAQGWGSYPDEYVKARTGRQSMKPSKPSMTKAADGISSQLIVLTAAASLTMVRR